MVAEPVSASHRRPSWWAAFAAAPSSFRIGLALLVIHLVLAIAGPFIAPFPQQ